MFLHLMQKQNLVAYSATPALAESFASRYTNWGILNRPHYYIPTIPQPPAIANNTVKRQQSRAMDMRYFWLVDQVDQRTFHVVWMPGLEKLGDYHTKHHPQPIVYIYEIGQLYCKRLWPQARCKGVYIHRSPLPRISTRSSVCTTRAFGPFTWKVPSARH